MTQVSVGPAGVWGVNGRKQIFHRTGTFGDVDSKGTGWRGVDGSLVQITSRPGQVVGKIHKMLLKEF